MARFEIFGWMGVLLLLVFQRSMVPGAISDGMPTISFWPCSELELDVDDKTYSRVEDLRHMSTATFDVNAEVIFVDIGKISQKVMVGRFLKRGCLNWLGQISWDGGKCIAFFAAEKQCWLGLELKTCGPLYYFNCKRAVEQENRKKLTRWFYKHQQRPERQHWVVFWTRFFSGLGFGTSGRFIFFVGAFLPHRKDCLQTLINGVQPKAPIWALHACGTSQSW